MPLFTLHRNHILRTTKGHTISFKKDQPINIPPVVVSDAVAIGAIAVNNDVDVLGEEEKVVAPLTAAERKAKVFDAFRTMAGREIREDFTASGVPNAKRLPALTGFEITSKERDTYWLEFRAMAQADKDQATLDAKVAEG
jgi:hypothetical protein